MSRLRAVWAFVAVLFRSLSRDRTALLFMVVLPILVIVVIGSAFGGEGRVGIGVVNTATGPVSEAFVAELEEAEGVAITDYPDADRADAAIRRGDVSAAVVVPGDLDDTVAGGGEVEIAFLGSASDQAALTARVAVSGAVDAVAARAGAARVVVDGLGGSFPDAFAAALSVGQGGDGGRDVEMVDIGGGGTRDISRFSLVAPQNLVLFVFITSLSGGAYLVLARRAGILRRVASLRTDTTTVLVGMATGWFAIALVQSLLILGIGALFFDVDWGDPWGAALLTVAFAAVGASAGLLVGAIGRDEDKVGNLAPIVGITLGALGGCMVPIEVFPPAMLAIAHAVPHYWAIVAWQRLVFDGGGVADIAGSLAVLTGFAVVLLGAASAVLRRQLRHG
ncbi:ABC transporter permease [Rhabdothermincola salaria]|uniref:ABC transporter permease n=1 Tax=Rhabdothermincola salaria TaxID=2903142 RepID=UPI001E48496F|nr:ABC transporter permease [Rhabdothermincola salaria]MCD9625542.1 ABC transporter permease [Rhabdothermincola salaria]